MSRSGPSSIDKKDAAAFVMLNIPVGLLTAPLLLGLMIDAQAQDQSYPTGQPSSQTLVPAGTTNSRLDRWFELQMATIYARYRYVEASSSTVTANQAQHKESFKGRFNFDSEGRYSLNAGLFSGRNFISTWNNTGLGTGDAQSNLALKQLFFSAMPWRGLEFQYGGLYIRRGKSTEITSYDDDGYFMGERVSVKKPDKLFFEEITFTYGYLGDITTPNILKRFHRLKESNYGQFLVTNKIGHRASISADYTSEAGRKTLRQAVNIRVKETRIFDSLEFENYQRVKVNPDYGFALYSEKGVTRRLKLKGGYAQIDPQYGGFNADRFGSGKRVFMMVSYELPADFTFSPYLTQAVGNHVPVNQSTRLDLVFNYNLLKGLQRVGLFRCASAPGD